MSHTDKLGLIVDQVRAGGFGNSNTGNTARKAFQNEALLAEISGVNVRLIHRLHVLLCVINSDHSVNREELKKYGAETAELWVATCLAPSTNSASMLGSHWS